MEPISDDEIEERRDNLGDEGGYRSDEAQEDPGAVNEDEDGEGGKGRRIDPSTSKKKIVRNPQPKLNAERIQGPKGVQTIEKYFEGFKFRGKGYEKTDLDRVLKRLEHWGHRLFPKYRFDDFLEKMEALGGKKNVQVYLKKYRLDMVKPDDDIVDLEDENEVREEQRVPEEEPVDEFDKLIAEQIEKQRQVSNEPPKQTNKPVGYVLGSANTAKPSELSEEVRARIEANRKLAIERKMARLRREEESKKRKLEETQFDSLISNAIDVISTQGDAEEARKQTPTVENVLVEVISRELASKPEDFGNIENDNNADERTKKRLTQDSLVEETSIAEVEERTERVEEPGSNEHCPRDLPLVEEEMQDLAAVKYGEEQTKSIEGLKYKERCPRDLPLAEQRQDHATVKYGEERTERIEEPKYQERHPEVLPLVEDEMQDLASGKYGEERTERIEKPKHKNERPKDLPLAEGARQDRPTDEYGHDVPAYTYEGHYYPKVNGQDYGEMNNGSERLLTHEELLMEIDGAMEEIINRSTRRST